MKKVCLFAALFFIFLCGSITSAQENQGKYVNSAAGRLVRLVGLASNDGFQLPNNSFSFGGGWYAQSVQTWNPLYNLTLQSGKNYRIICVGDMDAKDVDVQVIDEANNTVASDTATSAEAVVNFRPARTGRYTIRVRLFASNNTQPCVCMALVMVK